MAASDVAFLAPELVSEAEGPVPVPARGGAAGIPLRQAGVDIAFSLCAIAVLLVPSIVLCIAIRLESPGCPIYSQKRVGRIGRSGEVRTSTCTSSAPCTRTPTSAWPSSPSSTRPTARCSRSRTTRA